MKKYLNKNNLISLNQANLLLIFALGLQSCNFKKVDRVNHDGPQQNETEMKIAVSASENEKFIKSLDLTTLRNKVQSIKTESDATQAIQELESGILKSDIIDSPALKNESKVLDALSLYNFAIVRLFEIAPESAAAGTVSDKYQKLAMEGCNENLENCSKVLWLRKDARTARVLEMMAIRLDHKLPAICEQSECEGQLKTYYDLISVAFSTINAKESLALKSLFLKRASQYAKFNVDKNKNLFARHGKIFENIIANHPLEERNEYLEAIVKQFQPWSYSRLKSNSFAFGAEKIFAFAALHMMYDEKSDNLSAEFKKAIDDSQNETDPKAPLSFKQKLNVLKTAPDSTLIFKGLKVDISATESDAFYDEYFYMIDRLYRDHVNIEEVNSIWKGSHKDEKKLINAMLIYLKVELIAQMVNTNQYFTRILLFKNMTSDRLFRKTVDESLPLTQIWEKLFGRVDKISLFLSQQIKGLNTNNENASDQLKEANKLIRSIRRNTNFLSVYPNMLLLGYFMIHADAGFKYTTWWGAEIEIDPKVIVNYLLDGGFKEPWYPFSGDNAPLNKTEIIYAFYYALNAGAFETFSVIKDEKGSAVLDRVSFFKKALKKTMADYFKEIDDSVAAMNQFRQGNSDMETLLKLCKNEKNGVKDYPIPIKFEDLSTYSLTGGAKRGLGKTASGFYDNLDSYYYVSADNNAKDTQLTMRARLLDRLVQMRAMKVPLDENINQLNISAVERKAMADAIKAEIDDIESTLKKYLAESIKMHREIDECSERMLWMERERQTEIFKLEIQHLGRVYDAMTVLRATPDKDKETKIKELTRALNLETTEQISGDSYIYSKYALFRRFEKYSLQLKPKLDVEKPNKIVKDALESDLIPPIQFIDVGTNQPVDKQIFIASSLSKLNSNGSNVMDWFKGVHSLSLYNKKIRSLISMYRLGIDIGVSDDKQNSIQPAEIIKQALAMAKFASIQEQEKPWMILMSQPELIDKEEYRNLIFDQTETEYRGILDNAYNQMTRANSDLDEAARYALDSRSKSSLIFPIPEKIHLAIDKNYHDLVKNAEKIICDLNKTITTEESKIKQSDLAITYRIENGQALVYSPAQIEGGASITLDLRRKQYMKSIMKDFFFRRAGKLYKETYKEEECR